MQTYLGKSKSDDKIFIDSKSPNKSVFVTGISGSGKTSRMFQIELEAVLQDGIVVILDLNHTHDEEQILPQIRSKYTSLINRIDPVSEGVNLNLFEPRCTPDGTVEPYVNLVNSAVNALRGNHRMGERQLCALRRAVETAIQIRHRCADDAAALIYALAQQNSPEADAVYGKLWTLLNCGALKGGGKSLMKHQLNVVDLSNMDFITAGNFAEIFLSVLWRNIQCGKSEFIEQGMLLSIDEFQRLSLKNDGSLLHMLREGRKFSLSLLLATQTLEVFPKEILAILNQTASQLYFRPNQNEITKIAKKIAPEDQKTWQQILGNLRVGESVAVGDFNVGGHTVRRPILTI
ncbi:MAG TPA: ATP-binding protein [Candidatus Limivivens merdigallinarum]|uniref:ATP-binding protein n=1 Tax=Candidatus Limivivens merdigallinarum TaxID=2840859 RepID=A0A9D0ZYP9_9FIRM|nr:ATP-binding protein [Candidatus Limivivens merdigallinarum]